MLQVFRAQFRISFNNIFAHLHNWRSFIAKGNYYEWSRKIKYTLFFNDFWKGVCEREARNPTQKHTSDKEITISRNKNSKDYTLIATLVIEEVIGCIAPFTNSFSALKNLKDLYGSHS